MSVGGAMVGLLLGTGLLLLVVRPHPRTARRRRGRLADAVAAAQWPGLTVSRLVLASVAGSLAGGLAGAALTGLLVAAVLGAAVAGAVPLVVVRHRARRHRRAGREAWPEAIDTLVSGARAGLALPEAVADLARCGPPPLRPALAAFRADYQASGSFADACDALRDRLADPVADRVLAVLAIAREVGGHDVGRVLRTLSAIVRDDARARGEIEARQSWTVNAARVAAAAPWLTLGLLALRPETASAYASAGGAVVLVLAAVASVVAYLLMLRIARLPALPRLAGGAP
jgi:tight adherence protein B